MKRAGHSDALQAISRRGVDVSRITTDIARLTVMQGRTYGEKPKAE